MLVQVSSLLISSINLPGQMLRETIKLSLVLKGVSILIAAITAVVAAVISENHEWILRELGLGGNDFRRERLRQCDELVATLGIRAAEIK